MNQVPDVFLWILRHSLSFAQDIVFCMCRMDHLYGQLMLSPFTDQRYSARSSTQPLQCPNWKSSWTLLCPSLKWTQRELPVSDLWCFGNIWIIGTRVGGFGSDSFRNIWICACSDSNMANNRVFLDYSLVHTPMFPKNLTYSIRGYIFVYFTIWVQREFL